MATTVGQRKRTKGWRMAPGDLCVTRPGPFGNWWRVVPGHFGDQEGWWLVDHTEPPTSANATWFSRRDTAVVCAVDRFRSDLDRRTPRAVKLLARIEELRDRRLLCFCALGSPCHRDVLAELVDQAG